MRKQTSWLWSRGLGAQACHCLMWNVGLELSSLSSFLVLLASPPFWTGLELMRAVGQVSVGDGSIAAKQEKLASLCKHPSPLPPCSRHCSARPQLPALECPAFASAQCARRHRTTPGLFWGSGPSQSGQVGDKGGATVSGALRLVLRAPPVGWRAACCRAPWGRNEGTQWQLLYVTAR